MESYELQVVTGRVAMAAVLGVVYCVAVTGASGRVRSGVIWLAWAGIMMVLVIGADAVVNRAAPADERFLHLPLVAYMTFALVGIPSAGALAAALIWVHRVPRPPFVRRLGLTTVVLFMLIVPGALVAMIPDLWSFFR